MPTESPSQIAKAAVDQLSRTLNDLGSVISGSIERSSGSLNSTISTAVNSVNTTLGMIKTTLAGSLNINAIYADGESNVYNGFSGSITGSSTLTVWTPATGKRFLLKGYAVTGLISPDALSSVEGVLLYFADGGNSNAVVAPVAAIPEDATAEVYAFSASKDAIGTPVPVDLGSGRRGSATGSSGPLKLKADIDVGAGDIKVVGVVWGREV